MRKMKMKKIILLILTALLLFYGGTWIFNHINAWLGILVDLGGLYCLYIVGRHFYDNRQL